VSEPFFIDRERRPTEAAIAVALGERVAAAWRTLFEALHVEHRDLRATWRYYPDGRSWLLKVARRTRTIFWVIVEDGAFRVTFYFSERHTPALLAGDLSQALKAELRGAAPRGKLRAVTVRFGARAGVKDVLALVALKQQLR
jgi:hypothetical protein